MKPAAARELFDANARTYDRINTTISLGLDARWRAWAARQAVRTPGTRVLDAFSGTGLVGLASARLGAEVTLADISPGMLAVAEARARSAGLEVRSHLVDLAAADPAATQLLGAPFDAITMMFGARYLDDPAAVIRRLTASLKPGGRIVLVDFVEPDGSAVSRLAALYFFRVLPRIASVLAGRRELYDTLVATTHAMGSSARLVALTQEAGLLVEEVRLMGFGLVCGVVGIRADSA